MEAKLKAEELVGKYVSFSKGKILFQLTIESAKQCALIAVDEIIESEPQYKWTKSYEPYDYWLDVKQEIEKL